jgi:hypothetical protein
MRKRLVQVEKKITQFRFNSLCFWIDHFKFW